MRESKKKNDDFGFSIYITDSCTPEQREQNRQQYRKSRVDLGACPECLQLKSDLEHTDSDEHHEGESDAEQTIRFIIDGLWCGRHVGNCKLCGAPLFQPVM